MFAATGRKNTFKEVDVWSKGPVVALDSGQRSFLSCRQPHTRQSTPRTRGGILAPVHADFCHRLERHPSGPGLTLDLLPLLPPCPVLTRGRGPLFTNSLTQFKHAAWSYWWHHWNVFTALVLWSVDWVGLNRHQRSARNVRVLNGIINIFAESGAEMWKGFDSLIYSSPLNHPSASSLPVCLLLLPLRFFQSLLDDNDSDSRNSQYGGIFFTLVKRKFQVPWQIEVFFSNRQGSLGRMSPSICWTSIQWLLVSGGCNFIFHRV